MAAKLLHSLADDNPDLQKQIGCMTGIFQIFDRQHVLNNRRLGQKRLPPPPGDSHFTTGSSEREGFNAYHHHTSIEANLSKTLNEKQRLSTESSRASFSSSCSSLSSMDCNKGAQPEASSLDRILFPETPSRDPIITQTNTSPHIGRQSLDLRDVVKDSMYREARGLSVKTAHKEEIVGQSAKHKDSPRPLQVGKPADGSYVAGYKGKQNVPVDLNESLRVLAKLREAPWYYSETRERPGSSYEAKDGSWHTISKDAPRFSYEGRETNRLSFESRDTIRSIPKLKEMPPRLSLDSRAISMCSSSADSRPNYLSQNVGYSNERFRNPEQSSQKRPTSVVAKLMGLEALPDSMSADPSQSSMGKTSVVEQAVSFSKSLKTIDLSGPIRTPKSMRSMKEPTSPRWKNPDLIMKPISKLPIEQAPWKQQDGSRGFQKLGFMPAKLPAKTAPFPSVYSEIEKRLKDIEFNQSGKDLRALKQILEAMQSKGLLESRKEEQGSNFRTQRDYEPKCTSPSQRPRFPSQQNQQINHVNGFRNRAVDSLRTYESPIVIMKPAKLVERSIIPDSSVIPMDSISGLEKISSSSSADGRKVPINNRKAKDQSARSSHGDAVNSSERKFGVRNTKSAQSSTKPQVVTREVSTSSAKSSGSVSPKLQQRKLELEKRSRPPTPPSDSNKPRRQSNRQQTEAGSPAGKYRLKSAKLLPLSDDQSSQISNESRTSSHQGDDVSVQSDGNAIFDLKTDVEVSSAEKTSEINGIRSPFTTKPSLQKSPSSRFEEDVLSAELAIVAPEHPSPVSVLDASIYRDDLLSPSPVKQIPYMLTKVEGAQDCNDQQSEEQWNPADSFSSNGMGSGFVSEINRKKLQNIENLVQKLRRLNSTHDEASTDYIASLCENTNPDHRYISEILLASGLLLRDLSSGLTTFQLHQSGQPINPELFLVLEQTKATTLASKEECSPRKTEKFHRKLIFDAVNEILVKKLALVGPSPQPWLRFEKPARKTLGAQKLLKELCAEIEQLQEKNQLCSLEAEDELKNIVWDDIMHRSEKWTNFDNEVSGLVLDVERSIFKDLVDEIVIGGRGGLHTKPGRRRQLFVK